MIYEYYVYSPFTYEHFLDKTQSTNQNHKAKLKADLVL